MTWRQPRRNVGIRRQSRPFAVMLFSTVAFLAGVKVDEKTPPVIRNVLITLAIALVLATSIFMLRLPPNVGF